MTMIPFLGEELARGRREALRRAAEDARLARLARTARKHERLAGRARPSLRMVLGFRAISLGLRLIGEGGAER